ncbi:redoxin domain-containing protein [Flavobacterium luteum]|uniref:Redoxin domain-containing protein n=1 Tax=Flavobacterium luteum TaxID=2026654 RepID=A0A7J5AL38_9FLAO|nr:redoxin domain-containing protein [Flavobacterium luteum]KAB1157699.1 redoxin domain-containing protein [Flavobacterium luteum]
MRKYFIYLTVFTLQFVFSSYADFNKERSISNFKLKSATTNKWVAISDYKNAKGFIVVFLSNKCPMAKFYSKRLNQINEKYQNKGVYLLAINAMDTLAYADESFAKMKKKSKSDNFSFPYLQDKNQTIAKQFKAENTPQAFVVWKNKAGKLIVRYQGAIDDNAGEPEKAENHFLTDAVDELLNRKKVTVSKSESFGCKIYYRGEKNNMN